MKKLFLFNLISFCLIIKLFSFHSVEYSLLNSPDNIDKHNLERSSFSTLILFTEVFDVSCFGDCNGEIIIADVTGGSGSYSYLWDDPDNTTEPELDNLCPGDYTVIVADLVNVNCVVVVTYTIVEPAFFFLVTVYDSESANDANDGEAQSLPEGGTMPYNYEWSTGETTQIISGLSPGDYSLTVTDDNLCQKTTDFIILEYDCPEIVVDDDLYNEICFGACDGHVVINGVSGGTGPYSYQWDDEAESTTPFLNDLCFGLYGLTVTDEFDNCQALIYYGIDDGAIIELTLVATLETGYNAHDGTAVAMPGVGFEPYTYLWSTGETTQMIENLEPGLYYCTVTGANMCQSENAVEVSEYECPELEIEFELKNVNCNGACDGSISITDVNGGSGNYDFQWNDLNQSDDFQIVDLCPGDYSVVITDMVDNCHFDMGFTVSEPDLLTVLLVSTPESAPEAKDGTAIADPEGGVAPYIYQWSNGEITQLIIDLETGNYEVTVTDENGCTTTNIVEVDGTEVATNDQEIIKNITIYPNPLSKKINIDLHEDITVMTGVRIYTSTGKIVYDKKINFIKGLVTISLDDINKGFYVLTIQIDDSTWNHKFLIN